MEGERETMILFLWGCVNCRLVVNGCVRQRVLYGGAVWKRFWLYLRILFGMDSES